MLLRQNQMGTVLLLQGVVMVGLLWLTWHLMPEQPTPRGSSPVQAFGPPRDKIPFFAKVASSDPQPVVDPILKDSRAIAIRRTDKGWVVDTQVCNSTKTFTKATLKSIAGQTAIYINNPKTDIVSRYVQSDGFWERQLEAPLFKCFGNDTDLVFVDMGANIGVYSLAIAQSGRRVISLEPLIDNAERLCCSMIDGGFADRMTLVYNAVSDRRQYMEFHRYPGYQSGTYVRDAAKTGPVGESVYSIYLDDVLEVFPSLSKAVIKIDIERHEARALGRANKFFEQVDVPCMLMEWGHHRRSPDAYRLLVQMAKFGLLAYDPSNMTKSLDASRFWEWPDNVLWRQVRDYGPSTP